MAKPMINIHLKDGTTLALFVLKAIHHEQAVTFMTGSDFDDHELWVLREGNIQLTGTLTQAAYDRVRHAKTKESITLGTRDLAWVNEKAVPLPYDGVAVTVPMLKLDLTQPLTQPLEAAV